MPALYFLVLVSGQRNSSLNVPETYGCGITFIVFGKVTFFQKSCRGHMKILGAVICLKLFPLATISIKTHVSS